jgi:hypothetical protein
MLSEQSYDVVTSSQATVIMPTCQLGDSPPLASSISRKKGEILLVPTSATRIASQEHHHHLHSSMHKSGKKQYGYFLYRGHVLPSSLRYWVCVLYGYANHVLMVIVQSGDWSEIQTASVSVDYQDAVNWNSRSDDPVRNGRWTNCPDEELTLRLKRDWS